MGGASSEWAEGTVPPVANITGTSDAEHSGKVDPVLSEGGAVQKTSELYLAYLLHM